MTATTPVPLDVFVTELESLDGDAFVRFVGETYAATGGVVDIDGPRITARAGNGQSKLVVVSTDGASVPDDADTIVVASGSQLDSTGAAMDTEVVTPVDLRQRLLYAASPVEANAITERALGIPVRSATYGGTTDSARAADDDAHTTDSDPDTPERRETLGPTNGATERRVGSRTLPAAADSDTTPDRRVPGSVPVGSPDGYSTGSGDRERSADETTARSSHEEESSDRTRPWTAVAVVAVLLFAAGGIGFVAGIADIGASDAGASGDEDRAIDSPTTESTDDPDGRDPGPTTDGDTTDPVSADSDTPSGAVDRVTSPRPTCERPAIQVVQIQMNAVRYNDDETNDGIRTLRAFASPENREAVGSVESYVELFETPQYAPMLTYDTVQYSVPEITDDVAHVGVVTRENGAVTGRYEFRLVRAEGGSAAANDDLPGVDDCWMTDGVRSTSG